MARFPGSHLLRPHCTAKAPLNLTFSLWRRDNEKPEVGVHFMVHFPPARLFFYFDLYFHNDRQNHRSALCFFVEEIFESVTDAVFEL